MSPHLSDQMSQKSKVSWGALWGYSLNVIVIVIIFVIVLVIVFVVVFVIVFVFVFVFIFHIRPEGVLGQKKVPHKCYTVPKLSRQARSEYVKIKIVPIARQPKF